MKGFLKLKIIIPVVAVLLLGGGGFVATQIMHVNLHIVMGSPADAAASATPTPDPAASTAQAGIIFATAERVVNLADTGQYRYLKTQISLEFAMPKGKKLPTGKAYAAEQKTQTEELAPYQPRIDDTINSVLTSKASAELLKPEGKEALRAEMLEKLKEQLGEELGQRLTQVYFVQFIIQ